MENIVRIPSQQSSFNATNNLVDIILPSNSGVYDLSACFVTIDTRLNITTTAPAAAQSPGTGAGSPGMSPAGDAVQSVHIAYNHGAGSVYNNTATPVDILVRNASMMSASRGKVEDIRRSDTLRATVSAYLQDLDDVDARALTGTGGPAKPSPFVFGRHAQLFGEGTVLSKEQNHEVRIYLRDIFEACKVDAWDTAVYGNTHFHFELNLANVELHQILGDTAAANTGGGRWPLIYHNRAGATEGPLATYGSSVPVVYSPGGVGNQPVPANSVQTTVTMLPEYASLADTPHWVGQILNLELIVSGTSEAGSGATQVPAIGAGKKWCVVKGITYSEVTKQVTLDFGGTISTTTAITNPGVAGYQTEMQVTGLDVDAASLATATGITYDSVEMTAVRRTDIQKGPSQIQYSQFLCQSDQWASGTTLNRSYFLPAKTTNCIIVLPAANANGSNTVGSARLTNYRFTVNGESVTNRAVQYMPQATIAAAIDAKMDAGSALHYDLISNTMMNMGVRYSSLQECLYDQIVPINTPPGGGAGAAVGYLNLADCPRKRCYMLALPIPMSDDLTQLTVELEGQFGTSGALEMYSYVLSTI